jgi:hypothetical protein
MQAIILTHINGAGKLKECISTGAYSVKPPESSQIATVLDLWLL